MDPKKTSSFQFQLLFSGLVNSETTGWHEIEVESLDDHSRQQRSCMDTRNSSAGCHTFPTSLSSATDGTDPSLLLPVTPCVFEATSSVTGIVEYDYSACCANMNSLH